MDTRKFIEIYGRLSIIMIVLAAVLASKCHNSTDDQLIDTSILELSTKELIFTAKESYQFITVTSNSEFTAKSSLPWCVTSSFDYKRDNLKIAVTKNETTEERTAEITVTCDGLTRMVTVKQQAADACLSCPPGDASKFHLYLLIGQSNMAGRGIVDPQDREGNPRILRLNKEREWEIAKEPLHFDTPNAGVGPGLAFAREMLSDSDDIVIGLIPCAAGGSGIEHWRPGIFWEQTQTFPYDDALSRTKSALKDGTLAGILWHQGESEVLWGKVASYKTNLETLVAALRREFKTPSVPFLAGELSEFEVGNDEFNKVLYEVEKDILYFAVVSSKGLTAMPDGVHFDARSQREFGRRYAEKMKIMLNLE